MEFLWHFWEPQNDCSRRDRRFCHVRWWSGGFQTTRPEACLTRISVSMVELGVWNMCPLPILYPLPFPSLLLSLLPFSPPLPPSPSPYTMQIDENSHLIRLLVVSSGVVSTLAGQAGSTGSTNGIGTNAMFRFPRGIVLDAAGTFAVVVRG